MRINAWGLSFGRAWGASWGSIAETHDGGGGHRKPWHQKIYHAPEKEIEAKVRSYRMQREKLHADILFAMDGPAEGEVLDVIRAHVEPEDRAQFGAPDYVPQLHSLLSQTVALRQIAKAVLEEHNRQLIDDEESVFLLLNA